VFVADFGTADANGEDLVNLEVVADVIPVNVLNDVVFVGHVFYGVDYVSVIYVVNPKVISVNLFY